MTTSVPDPWVAHGSDVLERRCGDVVLLLQRGTGELRRLEGVAAATWVVTSEPMRVRELVAGAVSAAGPATDQDALAANVAAAVDVLCQVGVLTVGESPDPSPDARG